MSQQRANSIFKDDVERQDRPSFFSVLQELLGLEGSPSSPRRKRPNGAADSRQRRSSNPQAPQRASLVSVDENPLADQQSAPSERAVEGGEAIVRLDEAKERLLKQHIATDELHTALAFSVEVSLGPQTRLGLIVEQLEHSLWYVSHAKRVNDQLLPGEAAGIQLGDIILGLDFKACRAGASSLPDEIQRVTGGQPQTLEMQVLRFKDVCEEPPPGRSLHKRVVNYTFKALQLQRKEVLQYGEIWRFMDEVLAFGKQMTAYEQTGKKHGGPVFDQERIIMRVKGLRSALDVRCIHTIVTEDTVEYILRIEDVESGLQWQIRRRYREFYELHQQLLEECPALEDVPFPGKRLPAMKRNAKLVEERIGALEYFLRQCIRCTALFATIRPNCARALHIIQAFLFVSKHLSPSNPPPLDDQRSVEVLAHRLLNDPTSPACMFSLKFLSKADLDAQVVNEPYGYRPMLQHVAAALNELQQFMMQMHSQQMFDLLKARQTQMSADQTMIFVRRCVRRQVEAALYLPLRRNIIRILQNFLGNEIRELQQHMKFLRQRPPSEFGIMDELVQAPSWLKTLSLFQDITRAFLPADQGNMLKRSAIAVMKLHSEATQLARDQQVTVEEPDTAQLTRVQDLTIDPDPSSDTISTTNSATDDTELIGDLGETHRSPDIPDPTDASMQNSEALVSQLAASGVTAETLDDLAKRRSMRFPAAQQVRKPSLEKSDSSASEASKLVSLADRIMASLRGMQSQDTSSDSNSDEEYDQVDVCPEHPHSFDEKEGADSQKYNLEVNDPFTNTRNQQGQRSSIAESHSSLMVSELEFGSLQEPLSPSGIEGLTDDGGVQNGHSDPPTSPKANGSVTGEHARSAGDGSTSNNSDSGASAATAKPMVLAADDFLPMFTFILFNAAPTYLLLIKELMVYLVDEEEAFGEYGYYLATLEAAVQHIQDMYKDKTSHTQLEAV